MLDFRKSSINSALRMELKRINYPLQVMLTCTWSARGRWTALRAKLCLQPT